MEEKIKIYNRNKKRLSAILHTPKIKTDKIIIITHSFKGDKDYQLILRDFSRKAESYHAVIRFDCYGSGESEGKFEESSITTQVEDLKDVIKFVKSKGYKDICLIGLSLGAMVSVLAYDKTIKCLVLLSPVFQLKHLYKEYKKEILKRGYIIRERKITGEKIKVGKKMWEEFGTIETSEKLKQIESPTLAILGTKDEHITPQKAKKYMDLIPAKNKLEIIEGGDHDFLIKKAEEKAISVSLDWVKKFL